MTKYLNSEKLADSFKGLTKKEKAAKIHQFNRDKGFYEREDEDGFYENQQLKLLKEFFEAFDAFRKGNRCEENPRELIQKGISVTYFKNYVKDTFEDELADILIYCYDAIGSGMVQYNHMTDSYTEWAIDLSETDQSKDFVLYQKMYEFFVHRFFTNHYNVGDFCNRLAQELQIDLESHMYLKLAYNQSREKRHGKKS